MDESEEFNVVDKQFEKAFELFALQVGLKIGYYRRMSGMTQQELADASGLSLVYMGQIEAPNAVYPPSLKVLYKLSQAMGIKACLLLDVRI